MKRSGFKPKLKSMAWQERKPMGSERVYKIAKSKRTNTGKTKPLTKAGVSFKKFSAGASIGNGLKQHKPMKKKPPRMTKIRLSAKDENCLINMEGVCNYDTSTTVWCHANDYQSGKGFGLKARDEEGCYGCSKCHAFIDGGYANMGYSREFRDAIFDRARELSQIILKRKRLMK